MVNCSFVYKGKTYSKDRLTRLLVDELPVRSQQEGIKFLKEFLGMTDDEIIIIKGLIDGKSIGRFKSDGKILLSDLADVGVAYHEAFHRVWRMFLTNEERLQAIKEVKARKGIQSTIDGYREVYPKLSENELIEEILADEFADFKMNEDYKTELPIKTFFQRLWNFLKKLVGLKTSDIQLIYDKILSKSYKTAPQSVQQYLKDADKILIEGHEFSVEEKNELIQVMTQQFVKSMLDLNGNIDIFLNSPTVKMKQLVDEYVVTNMLSDMINNGVSEDLVTAVNQDVEKWLLSNKFEDSIFVNGMVQNLRLIGLVIKDDTEDLSEGALEADEKQVREYGAPIEVDPKSKMGKKIKLLLSSFSDPNEKTNNFGFPKPVGWTKAFNQIATKMVGIPTSVFREELKALNVPYVQDLIEALEKDVVFGNEFISTMAMTENKFMKMNYKDGDIYFFDANSGTRRDKLVGEWKNNLIRKVENWDEWKEEAAELERKKGSVSDEEIMEHFGLALNFQVPDLRSDLNFILSLVDKYKGDKPDPSRLFEQLGIKGYVNSLAEKQSVYEDHVDLMVMLGSKKLYTLGLNTQQTQVINGVKYAQSKFTSDMTTSQKIELLKEFAPFQVSEFNVTKLESGEYLIHNKWLEKILEGEKLELVIPYQVDTQSGEDSEIAKLEESDLMALHLNGALQGVNISMKHADRGTFFAYTFGNNKPLYVKQGNVADTLRILERNIIEQIELEAKFYNNMLERNIPVQYIGKQEVGAFSKDIIGVEDFKSLLATGEVPNKAKITEFISNAFEAYRTSVEDYGLLGEFSETVYKDGKKTGEIKKLKGVNNNLRFQYANLDLLLASAFINEVSSHIFEVRFFSGDVRSFKSGTDLFKRLAPQSSTGNLTVTDDIANNDVRTKLDQDFEILNPVTGETTTVNPSKSIGEGKDKYFRAVTGAERSNYKSHLLEPALSSSGKPLVSKLTGNNESKLFMMFEDGFIKDFPDTSLEDLKKTYLPKFKLYEEKYADVNENDGISYMVLPAFKNFMLKQGKWTDGMETVYQTEMKIAQLTNINDIANIEITVKGVTFKPFEIKSEELNGKKIDGWKKRIVGGKLISTEALHTLKTQFAGYSTPEEYFDEAKSELEYWFNTIFKTSQHLLLPSAILGTNLQLMNFSLLSNGIDIYHMGSANKVGGVDAKLAAKNITKTRDTENVDIRNSRRFLDDIQERGLDFYNKEGFFNHEALTKNLDILSYLSDWNNQKNQVQIGNKVKDEIKGSTQSLKILLSNLVVNSTERFVGAQQLINDYKEVVKLMVANNHTNLLNKIGFNYDSNEFESLDKLKKAVLESSQMQSAPENTRNAVENFFNDPSLGIEAVPMKNKIENVLYALITNGIISFDRPGSSYPQTAVTGYEKLGSRTFNEDGTQRTNQDTLKFYNPIFDEDGNVTSVEPAEVIMPLPDYWIKPLLRWAKTNNLVKALEKLNADISNRPELFQFKGLRIPNQQLSSNDFFQVKRFTLPTMQNYIIIPSEMVVKSGGDFDIDKLNIYWAADTESKIFDKVTEDEVQEKYNNYLETNEDENPLTYDEFKANYNSTLDRVLLEQEKNLLLHPRNAHHLLMPLTDEIFVKDIYNELVSEGLIEEPTKSFFGAMLPTTNVKNAVIFVKGKYGVGPVALGITNSATNQADTLSIAQNYVNQDNVARPTKLLFEGLEDTYTLDNYTDNKGTVISEILSQLLTTQVDNVKNPTAVLMNINMQTLGVMLYLIRRKVNPKSAVLLLQQPLVKQYLIAQRQNESLFNKNADSVSNAKGNRKAELSKKDLISKLLAENGYSETELVDSYTVIGSTSVETEGLQVFRDESGNLIYDESNINVVLTDKAWSMSDRNMMSEAKAKSPNKQQQLLYLSYFVDELQPQARAFSDFQQTQNSDTKGLKDKQMLDETDVIFGRTQLSGIIPSYDISRLDSTGVISPFYQFGRKSYRIYDRFYSLLSSPFAGVLTDFKNKAAAIAPSTSKDRVRQTIENDFILFLVHNYVLTKDEFNKLMKGDENTKSVASRVKDLKLVLPSNLVLKSFFPMLSNSVDQLDNKRVDNLRLFEKELNSLDNNDMRMSLEEIAETDLDLYTDIVKLLMFQTGLNISPFNYRSVMPVGLNQNRTEFNEYQYLYADILKDAVKTMRSKVRNQKEAKLIFKDFQTLFAANNPQFLRKNFYHPLYPYPLTKAWDRKTLSFTLHPNDGRGLPNTNLTQPTLGNAYMKQYFLSGKITNSRNPNVEKEILNKAFEQTVFNEKTEVTINSPQAEVLNKYELFPGVFANQGQTEALDLIEKFLSSNEQEFTLIGRGGTGKTTIVKKVLSQLGGKSVMGVTVSHKAKKVLGRSIGKDKVKTFASATSNKMNESTGKFEPDMYARQQGRVPISQIDVVIVDEASMISPRMRDEINTLIQKGTKVIYMGDNAQLPPVGEVEDSPVFNNKNQYTLKEKMRQAKTSPIIGIGSTIAENIESPNFKTVAIKPEDRKNQFDNISKSEVVFISEESKALEAMVRDIKLSKDNPDFVKAVTFNNENHNASQSVKNLNDKIRAKLWGDKASNQLNVGEMLTAYDSYATIKNPTEDDMIIHNSEDFIVTAFSKRTAKSTVTVSSKAKGERSFRFEYDVLDVELINDEGLPIKGHVVEMIADSSKAQFDADLARLWKEDTQLAIALKGKFANLQYGYAITSHKAQGSTYTNTYVFEDNILGPTNAGDAITKNKSLYVAVSRPTTKLVMISERNGDQVNQSVQPKVEKLSAINIYSTDKNGYEKLSNLEGRKFKDKDGREYFSVEHAYQSWKSGSFDEETYKKYTKGGVKITGNKGTKTENNWNINLMKRLIKLSLDQNPDIADLLVGTGTIPLTHTQDSTIWKTEFPKLLMEIRDELKGDYQTMFEADKSESKYSPSLKLYEGFINLNQLYTGDEILPFIGESEYYRYLVPMLLRMNPNLKTIFSEDVRQSMVDVAISRDLPIGFIEKLTKGYQGPLRGVSSNTMNTNFINETAPVKTIVHEMIHRTLQREYEKGGEFKQKIDDLYEYADSRIEKYQYGLTSATEFLAEAMTDPDFMEILNNIQYQDETIWSYLMTLVSDFINNLLNIELKSDSVLAEVVRVSEQVLNNNVKEMSKDKPIEISSVRSEILDNWDNYFPRYSWMNDAQKQMTAKLVEEGKINLTCKI